MDCNKPPPYHFLMIKPYQIICLDKQGKPQTIATIEANGKKRAKLAGINLSRTLGMKFHLVKLKANGKK